MRVAPALIAATLCGCSSGVTGGFTPVAPDGPGKTGSSAHGGAPSQPLRPAPVELPGPPSIPAAGEHGVIPAPTLVQTDRGAVRGDFVETLGVVAYRGIPYAAPPVGDARFRPPADVSAWDGIRPALAFGPPCLQATTRSGRTTVSGSEDCLTLNVWRALGTSGLQPVMVFLHGGSHVTGSSSDHILGDPTYDGSLLAAHTGAVVATVDFRLGPLGYLADDSLGAGSANAGLLDQIAALEFLKRNASKFGGDPDRIMVFGTASGGADVCALLGAPRADRLLSSAAIESGFCPSTTLADRAFSHAQLVVARNRCAAARDRGACLRSIPGAQLLLNTGPATFGPVIDGDVIPDAPIRRLESGERSNVPLIVGANSDEMFFLVPQDIDADGYRDLVGKALGSDATQALTLYPPGSDPVAALVRLKSDQYFVCPARRIGRAAASGGSAVFQYLFAHALGNLPPDRAAAWHGLEVSFVFRSVESPWYSPSSTDQRLADAMSGAWFQLAERGDPGTEGGAWAPWSFEQPYTVLDDGTRRDDGLRSTECDFWDAREL